MNPSNRIETETKTRPLKGKRVAILATDGFEQAELTEPREALERAGATTRLIAPKHGKIKGWKSKNWGDEVAVDVVIGEARVDDYDALLLPGGVMNPDRLRTDKGAVNFVRSFFDAEKPVAAICHGPIMLIEAEVLRDRHLTSWPSLATDMRNAGARWSDEEVVVDRGLVTSRQPTDIPAFNRKMIEEFAEGAVSTRMDRNSVEA
ncbi:MAG: type 1 glutamine amidotransferase [Betaproteobacteria bacterium]|nr:MAG: type 1 glutamine amidotransferase [Betaproteobacteria bacterium]